MSTAVVFLAFSNLVAPLIAGLFLCLCLAYFAIANPSAAASYRYFVVFLIGFGAFVFGRPLQLLLGPYPMPLIIVNVRVFILCAVVAPSIILAADSLNKRRSGNVALLVILPCALLGLTYDVFNTLGTKDSYLLFEIAGLAAFDNLTPSALPPFFGREVTIGVQIVTGALLLASSIMKLKDLRSAGPFRGLLRNKNFPINAGIVLFAVAFIAGSLLKQWWVYYATSIVTSLLFGASVLMDVKEVHGRYEKLVPFIKEDIASNVALGEFSETKLAEMLHCLGKRPDLNAFAVIKVGEKDAEPCGFQTIDDILALITRRLAEIFGQECFLPLPLSNTRIGVALRLSGGTADGGEPSILEILEKVREEVFSRHGVGLSIGVGRRYERMEDLRISYHEAVNAQEYAEQFVGNAIVHVDNISHGERPASQYPVKERERLLSAVRLGDAEGSARALEEFMSVFRPFIEARPRTLAVRLHELVGALVDSAVRGGGDEEKLNGLIERYAGDIELVKDPTIAGKWLAEVVAETAGSVTGVLQRRSRSLIENAKTYIEANYRSPLSYKDVARAVFISPSYFMSLFKRETGTTFVDYLTGVRIDNAKRLLVSSSLSVTSIAYEVGFNSSNYFSFLFRRIVGTSAKTYRASRARYAEDA
jgi:two-component system response regulator YesN